jgi:phospholipid N-methyltransferase
LIARAMASPALLFARQFLANPRRVGAVAPASPALVRCLLDGVDWDRVHLAVEYGPGTGVVTRAMLARMRPDARLIAFEINADFARYLTQSIADPRLTVLAVSAAEAARHVPGTCDVAISSLPLGVMPQAVRGQVLAATAQLLGLGAALIGYQYSPARLAEVRRVFPDLSLRIEPRNLPPAVVFTARR